MCCLHARLLSAFTLQDLHRLTHEKRAVTSIQDNRVKHLPSGVGREMGLPAKEGGLLNSLVAAMGCLIVGCKTRAKIGPEIARRMVTDILLWCQSPSRLWHVSLIGG